MQQLISGIATGAPVWVWPLLVGLTFLGWRSSKDRDTSLVLFYGLPFIGVMSLNGIASLPLPAFAWSGFVIGYALGVAFGFRRQVQWVERIALGRVFLRGEWFTMTVLMITFWSNFVGGTVRAVSSETYNSPGFITCMTLVIGAAGGTFLGRSSWVILAARKAS